jgi:hypothetical protein
LDESNERVAESTDEKVVESEEKMDNNDVKKTLDDIVD